VHKLPESDRGLHQEACKTSSSSAQDLVQKKYKGEKMKENQKPERYAHLHYLLNGIKRKLEEIDNLIINLEKEMER